MSGRNAARVLNGPLGRALMRGFQQAVAEHQASQSAAESRFVAGIAAVVEDADVTFGPPADGDDVAAPSASALPTCPECAAPTMFDSERMIGRLIELCTRCAWRGLARKDPLVVVTGRREKLQRPVLAGTFEHALLQHVPFGEDARCTSREIQAHYPVERHSTVRHALMALEDRGAVCSVAEVDLRPGAKTGSRKVRWYWRPS